MTVLVEYNIGDVAASERHIVMRRADLPLGTGRLIVCCHGRGANAHQMSPAYADMYKHMEPLVEEGFVLLSIDAGPTLYDWGNSAVMSSITGAIAWARSTSDMEINRPRVDPTAKVAFFGWSMGGLASVQFLIRNSGLNMVAGAWCWTPAINIDDAFANAPWTAEINTAYGGNYTTNGRNTNPSWNPSLRMSDKPAGVPVHIVHPLDDSAATPSSSSQAFAAGTTGTTIETPASGGHFAHIAYDPSGVYDFFTGLSY